MADERDEPRDLQQRNRELDEQLKLLVKAEHRLYKSQRELGLQLRRVDAVNRLALEAAMTDEPAEVAQVAFDALFRLFPYEQGLAVLADGTGALSPLAIRAVPGCEHDGETGLKRLGRAALEPIPLPAQPVIANETGTAPAEVARLLSLLDQVFASPGARVAEGSALVLPLALGPRHTGALVLRRLGRAHSFHEVLPSEKDHPFLILLSQQIAAALGKAVLVVSLRRSYAELEATQQELVARERLAAIGELAAVVAHEVRNPLGAIFNSLAAIEREAQRGEATATPTLLGVVREEATRLNRIVGDLIDFARPRPPSKRDMHVAPIAADAIESARADAETRTVALELDADDEVHALVDEHLLRRALLNLVDNATQATGEGGVVTVRVAREDRDIVIQVADQGHGIAAEEIDKIFEPFFTTRATGTGLGLAVVKRFVDSHHGTVDVQSEPGSGSRFTLRFGAA